MPKQNIKQHILLLLITCPLIFLAYIVNRQQFFELISCFAIAFVGYFYFINELKKLDFNTGFAYAVIIRIVLLLSIPALSDDFYRFLWDGRVLANGLNPYGYKPNELLRQHLPGLDNLLYYKLNSPVYFTVYPPLCQLVFYVSALTGQNVLLTGVLTIKIIFLLADIGNIYLLKKLLLKANKPVWLVLIYALNPLVIMEFAGNLHFEVLMIFTCLLSLYLLFSKRIWLSAVFMGFAVCIKLIPLLFIPLLFHSIGFKKTLIYTLIVGLTTLALFLPLIHDFSTLKNLQSSIALYYGSFEFNGSVYQVLKWYGWRELNYNPIAITSKILLILSFTSYLLVWGCVKNIYLGIFLLLAFFNLFAAIVHPWYILPMLAFGLFINTRLAIIWTALITLTYFTYRVYPYQESLFLVAVEYVLLFIYISYEWYFKKYLSPAVA